MYMYSIIQSEFHGGTLGFSPQLKFPNTSHGPMPCNYINETGGGRGRERGRKGGKDGWMERESIMMYCKAGSSQMSGGVVNSSVIRAIHYMCV